MSTRNSFFVGAVLALFMLIRGWDSLRQKSATFDEWGHIENGLALTRPWDDRFHLELTHLINPPVGKALAVATVRTQDWAEAERGEPTGSRCRAERKLSERMAAFPFRFDIDTRRLLGRCRATVLLLSLLGIPTLFFLCGELKVSQAGPWAALVYALSPNIMAHARLATPDLPVTVLFLMTALAWLRLGYRPSAARAGLAATAFGLALATKYSAVLMTPVLATTVFVALPGQRLRVFCLSIAAGLGAGIVVALIYDLLVIPALGTWPWVGEHGYEVERFSYLLETGLGRLAAMPLVLYRYGAVVAGRATMKSFLVGHHTMGGWLSYFPIAISIKTALSFLLTLSIAAGWGLRHRSSVNRGILWLAAIPGVYMFVTLVQGIQVGIRHLLPIYPFLVLFAGLLLSAWWRRGSEFRLVSAILAVLMIAESVSIHPHYLAYFNAGVGTPDRGYHYLVDCNLDWGQDLPALVAYQREHVLPTVSLSYFGSDAPGRFGLDYRVFCSQRGRRRPPPGVYAISATNRQGLYSFPNRMEELAWFRQTPPTNIVAHTILIYDLRKR